MATRGWPTEGWMAVLRRQPVRVVNARPEGGYTAMFEITCCDCGDDPSLDYSEASPGHQLVRGPYSLAAGTAAYEQHFGLHQQLTVQAAGAGERMMAGRR